MIEVTFDWSIQSYIADVTMQTLTFQWISSFLTMPHQRVVTDNTFYSLTAVTSGAPQGTA